MKSGRRIRARRGAVLFCAFLMAQGVVMGLAARHVCYAGSANRPFIVYIDIGHTKSRPGATSARGTGEYYFNERIGKALYEELSRYSNIKAVLPAARDGISLLERAQSADSGGANLFFSVHHDSVQPMYLQQWVYEGKKLSYCDKFRGFSIFVSNKNKYAAQSLQFAKLLGSMLLDRSLPPSLHHAERISGENRTLLDPERGVYEFGNLAVLKNANMPAVLLECGVIVNRDEELLLMKPEYQRKIVTAIAESVREFSERDRKLESPR